MVTEQLGHGLKLDGLFLTSKIEAMTVNEEIRQDIQFLAVCGGSQLKVRECLLLTDPKSFDDA